MGEWKKFIKENGLEYNSNQELFYNRIQNFLKGETDFLDDDGNAVENVIIYGYPYMQRGIEYEDYLNYWIKKLDGNVKRAQEYVEFFPISSRIYQACMRAKRSESDNPIILLWGKEFSKGNPGYKYSYNELKGGVIYESKELLEKLESLKRVDNGNI